MMQEKKARLEEKNSLLEKLTKAEKSFEQEKTRRAQSARELEDTKENFKTQQLINMEMKDYERAVNELKNQVEMATNEAEAAKRGYFYYYINFIFKNPNSSKKKMALKFKIFWTKCAKERKRLKMRWRLLKSEPRNIDQLSMKIIGSSMSFEKR